MKEELACWTECSTAKDHTLQCIARSTPGEREGGRAGGLAGEEMDTNILFTVEWGPVGGWKEGEEEEEEEEEELAG